MRTCDLNNVKKHGDWDTVVFEVDSNRNERLVIGGRPSVGCEVEGSFVILVSRSVVCD